MIFIYIMEHPTNNKIFNWAPCPLSEFSDAANQTIIKFQSFYFRHSYPTQTSKEEILFFRTFIFLNGRMKVQKCVWGLRVQYYHLFLFLFTQLEKYLQINKFYPSSNEEEVGRGILFHSSNGEASEKAWRWEIVDSK